MKRILYVLLPLTMAFVPNFVSAQDQVNQQVQSETEKPELAVIGQWRGEAGGSEIEFYQTPEGIFESKVIWVKDPKFKDNEGVIFIKDMTYDEKKGAWITNYLFSPEHKLVAKGELKIKEGVLYIKGRKFGISVTEKFFRK